MNTSPSVIEICLQPGDFYFGDASTRVRTLLGSCVAITLWHPTRLVGGMCHYMLPSRRQPGRQLDGKYADEAMELFRQAAARHHTRLEEYQVKLFGGGNMFPGFAKQTASVTVADHNVAAAHRLVARHRLQLSAQDLGRSGHRNVIFDIASGHVWVRHQRLTGS
ncbi:MAG: chemoreceptor glutamine deamidase CheD [Pseudomonas sp.]|nr:chemoreceptor glutamine deamidase CheD [Pseudomonas sp.]